MHRFKTASHENQSGTSAVLVVPAVENANDVGREQSADCSTVASGVLWPLREHAGGQVPQSCSAVHRDEEGDL